MWTWRRFWVHAMLIGFAVTAGFAVAIAVITGEVNTALQLFLFPPTLMALVLLAASRFHWKARLGSWVELSYRGWVDEASTVLERFLEGQGIGWTRGEDDPGRPNEPPPFILQDRDAEVILWSDGMTTWVAVGPVPGRSDAFRAMVEDLDLAMERALPGLRRERLRRQGWTRPTSSRRR